jgi:WD40 repeat protein
MADGLPKMPARGAFTMKSKTSWLVTAACVGLGCSLLGLVIVGAKPPADPPITLHYRETPIFLDQHDNNVSALAFSADGKTLATGSGFLRLWDAATGQLRSIHSDDATRGVDGIAFSPDGRSIAVVGGLFGKEAELWETASGRIVQEFAEPSGVAPGAPFIYKGKPTDFRVRTAVAFSPDGRILATAPDAVVLREISSGNILAILKQPAKGVKAIAFSPDGKTLATAAEDRKVRLWSVPEGTLQATLTGPTQPLSSVAFSPDGTRIVATGSGKRSILSRDETPVGYLWSWAPLDLSSGPRHPNGPARKIELGNVHVRQVAFVGPTTVVVAAGRELLSLDLQAEESTPPRKVWTHSGEVLAVAVSPDRRLVASGSADRTVDVVDIASGKLVYRLPGLTDIFSSVAASQDGKRFATATIDMRFTNRAGVNDTSFAARHRKYFAEEANADRMQPSEVRIWSTDDGRLQSKLPLPPCQVTAIELIPHGNQLAVAGWTAGKGGMLSVWDLKDGKLVRELAAPAAEILAIAVSADGTTLASGDVDGNLDIWNLRSGAKIRSHKYDHAIEAVTFSADGKLLATGDGNRTVRLMDASSGKITRTLHSRSYIESLDFSPDANRLAAGTRDPGLELWDLRADTASRTLVATGDHFDAMPGFVAFSPDGRFVVCGGHGKDIAVFDAASGTLFKELRGHAHPATRVAFLPDGRLVSGGEERMIKLWDPNAGTCLASWVVVPADAKQHWDDQWVGVDSSGNFVSSTNSDRLVGWQTSGDFLSGPETPDRRRRVEKLFQAE